MPYDRELKTHVLDARNVYMVGLSDEGGAGANVGFASKVGQRPTQAEVGRLDDYIQHTLWGEEEDGQGVPVSLQDHSSYGIRSSMFWVVKQGGKETGMPGYNYTPNDGITWTWDFARGSRYCTPYTMHTVPYALH
jgi:hypothetical protein